MLKRIRDILEMIRFSHTVFALPFALLAAVMAWSIPAPDGTDVEFRWQHLLGILICMVSARSAAMAFNRIADRKLDADNPRTQGRHLPAGRLSMASVATFTIVMCVVFVAATALFLPNQLPLLLSVPVLLFLLAYSYTKRYTALAHFWLGASLMLAPVSAWIALRGEWVMADVTDLVPSLILGSAVLTWVAGFDIIYACQDVDHDVGAKLHSVPARLGVVGALRMAAACHVLMVGALLMLPLAGRLIGPDLELGWIYWVGIAAIAGLLIYEHTLVRPDDLTRVNVAFFRVNAIVSIGLFVVVALDLLFV